MDGFEVQSGFEKWKPPPSKLKHRAPIGNLEFSFISILICPLVRLNCFQ